MHFMCRRKVVGDLAEAEQRKDGDEMESDGRKQTCDLGYCDS